MATCSTVKGTKSCTRGKHVYVCRMVCVDTRASGADLRSSLNAIRSLNHHVEGSSAQKLPLQRRVSILCAHIVDAEKECINYHVLWGAVYFLKLVISSEPGHRDLL